MSRGWIKSGLEVGERVKLSRNLFEESYYGARRVLYCTYLGDTPSGILVDCVFKSAVDADEPEKYHYRKHINWAKIYCGDAKVKLSDGSLLKARREKVNKEEGNR